uniref:hypothetical protein n=1 Tax=Prevotella sp. TaxID=59823 RepID=UPI004029674A
MAVDIKGMVGDNKTYFAGSPVVIDITGLEWNSNSPFNIVRVNVMYGGKTVGDFHADTGGQTAISFDIQSALRSIWADYDFAEEVKEATAALTATSGVGQSATRSYRSYSIQLSTEYLDSHDNEFTSTESQTFPGGSCMIGALTEWERYNIAKKEDADASHWDGTNPRNGDASTKPTSTPERVGRSSLTSWVDFSRDGTMSVFYPPAAPPSGDDTEKHAPLVLRDTIDYQDFLFVNRRGAVETASALMKEALNVSAEVKQYNKVERPAFKPSRSLLSVPSGGRRSWEMSSGYVSREWAAWWAQDFLQGQRHWMLLEGMFVPVIVEPAKKSVSIYDRSKQQLSHVDFTVTLALEG